MRRACIAWAAALVSVLPIGCAESLDRGTPEAALASARQVVIEGHAERLAELIYAENEDMQLLVNRFGVLLGNLQDLGVSIGNRFPNEVKAIREDAERAAKEGRASGLLAQLAGQAGVRPRNAREGSQVREGFERAITEFMADPYGWLERSEGRLTTEEVDDDTVAVLLDGKPLMSPIGLTMRRDKDDRWCLVLPTSLPGVSSLMPRTPEQYEIFGSVIETFDNVIVDLKKDVDQGRITSLDRLSTVAGEKTFIPVVMTMYAYNKASSEAKKKARETSPGG